MGEAEAGEGGRGDDGHPQQHREGQQGRVVGPHGAVQDGQQQRQVHILGPPRQDGCSQYLSGSESKHAGDWRLVSGYQEDCSGFWKGLLLNRGNSIYVKFIW